jgi:hypothetical protein
MTELLEGPKARTAGVIFWVIGVLTSLVGFLMVIGRYAHLHADDRDERMEEGIFYTGMGIGFFGLVILIIAGSVYIGKTRGHDDKTRKEGESTTEPVGEVVVDVGPRKSSGAETLPPPGNPFEKRDKN